MARYLFLLLPLLILNGCATESTGAGDPLVGTWQLTEQLIDIGDGNGSYQPVESGETLVFRADGTVTANFNFCNPIDGSSQLRSGTWSLEDGTLQPDCRPDRPLPIALEGDVLTLRPFCIEQCGDRYRKVE